MPDFTHEYYAELLFTFQDSQYEFQTLKDAVDARHSKCVTMRHDVDRLPQNALKFARLESAIGFKSTYYFRSVPESWDEEVISEVAKRGHEVGYHNENMDTCDGDVEAAWDDFRVNLERFRQIYPVKTVCMHGSPLSKYDNRDLWEKYDYTTLGIIAEPYFDIDYNQVFYLTDTGRKWNNIGASIRDKVESKFDISITNTRHLIQLIQAHQLPDKLLINTHPQRWHNRLIPWVKELVSQRAKNAVKRVVAKRGRRKDGK